MGLNINTNLRGRSGFTIVELLIVIVVIGILAAITIVAFNGVQSRANTTKAQSNAVAASKMADAYNADSATGTTGYPTLSQLNSPGAASVAKLPSGVTAVATVASGTGATPNATNGLTTVGYTQNTNSGCIAYWDFSASALRYLAVGSATLTVTSGANTGCTLGS